MADLPQPPPPPLRVGEAYPGGPATAALYAEWRAAEDRRAAETETARRQQAELAALLLFR